MTQRVPPLRVSSTDMRWLARALCILILILFVLLGVMLLTGQGGLCGCEHDPMQGSPPPVQTPMATPGAIEERSYEKTCDGAQAYFDDLWAATNAHVELATPVFHDGIEFYLAYFRSSNPPPIMEEWTDAHIAFWAALSDSDAESMDLLNARLDAIHAAEDKLEDACEGYEFTEDFWG